MFLKPVIRLNSSISNSRAIVDFRNLLAHDYGVVDDDAVLIFLPRSKPF
jgi:uncharacterized protein YutE (UPF0331/DUF86 family)